MVSENAGTVYINLCEEQNFVNALQVQDVRFLMPEVSEHDKEAIENLRQIAKMLEEPVPATVPECVENSKCMKIGIIKTH